MVKFRSQLCVLGGSKVLLVDGDELLLRTMGEELRFCGSEVLSCGSLQEAREGFTSLNPDLVVCAGGLPDGRAESLLNTWHSQKPDLLFLIIGDYSPEALRFEAFDHLRKPFDLKDLKVSVGRALEMCQLKKKLRILKGRAATRDPIRIIGESEAMVRARKQLEQVCQSRAGTILIIGESGTGKELAARAIHDWSDRKEMPFIEIDCASMSERNFEIELFGCEKGFLAGERTPQFGLFDLAQNGTIFLDEIAEMPLKMQSKLLRVVELRRFMRFGGSKEIVLDARIVAATNRNLLDEITLGNFRRDLYYRLSALPIVLPPLRERLDDLDLLIDFFVEKLSKELLHTVPKVAASARKKLRNHWWPGNLRELRNVLERAIVFSQAGEIAGENIEIDNPASIQKLATQKVQDHSEIKTLFTLPDHGIDLEDLERDLLVQALRRSANNQTRAAELLGISRHTLRYRLEKYGLVNNP